VSQPTAADRKVSIALKDIARRCADDVQRNAGEAMGVALLIFPLGRLGAAQYISNVHRESMRQQLRELLDHWDAGMPEIPAHERQ
jgi:hypothetical protein